MVGQQAFSHELFPTCHEAVSARDRRPRRKRKVFGSCELTARIVRVLVTTPDPLHYRNLHHHQ